MKVIRYIDTYPGQSADNVWLRRAQECEHPVTEGGKRVRLEFELPDDLFDPSFDATVVGRVIEVRR